MRRMIKRLIGFTFVALLTSAVVGSAAWAHHGWGWATDQEFELTGKITDVRLGNPHGEVTLDVDGKTWTVEIGQPWRNERAGLSEKLLSKGQVMTVHGHRSAKADELLVKAKRVVIDGKAYNLYPDRAS